MKKHLQKDKCFITCLMSHNQRLVALIFKMGLVILATFHLDFPGQTWVVTCCGDPDEGKTCLISRQCCSWDILLGDFLS